MPQDNIIGHILGKQKRLLLNRPSDDWVLSDTMLGVEIEVEKVSPNLLSDHPAKPPRKALPADMALYWAIHKDESLHNYGGEFSFVTPMFGEDVSQALNLFLEFQKKEGFEASLRTGIHVHMDARDLSRFQLLGLLAYYIIFEPAIYAWVGDDRDCNNFCVPWYRAEGALNQAIQILVSFRDYYNDVNKENENALAYCEQFHRYAGLNLQSLFKFGSIEFRQLKTTFNPTIIRSWINILLSLKKAAQMAPESSMTIISDIKHQGLKNSALSIFGSQFVKSVWSTDPEIEEKIVEFSLPNAVELINQVNYASSSNGELLTWFPDRDAARAGKKPHPWFARWRKNNFPKDLKIPPEEKLELRKSKKYALGAGWGSGVVTTRSYDALYGQLASMQAGAQQAQVVNHQFQVHQAPAEVVPGHYVGGQVIGWHPQMGAWAWDDILAHLDHGRRPEYIYKKQVPAAWIGYMPDWGYEFEFGHASPLNSGYRYRPDIIADTFLTHARPPNLLAIPQDFGMPAVMPQAPAPAPVPEAPQSPPEVHNSPFDDLDGFYEDLADNHV